MHVISARWQVNGVHALLGALQDATDLLMHLRPLFARHEAVVPKNASGSRHLHQNDARATVIR
jgi:hypothetical protein